MLCWFFPPSFVVAATRQVLCSATFGMVKLLSLHYYSLLPADERGNCRAVTVGMR